MSEIINASDPVQLTLKWHFKEHRDGETATFRGAGIELYVMDRDGDGSIWVMKRGKVVLAEGSDYGSRPYHFDACLLAAEAALRAEVRRIVAEAHVRRDAQCGRSRMAETSEAQAPSRRDEHAVAEGDAPTEDVG